MLDKEFCESVEMNVHLAYKYQTYIQHFTPVREMFQIFMVTIWEIPVIFNIRSKYNTIVLKIKDKNLLEISKQSSSDVYDCLNSEKLIETQNNKNV